MNSEKVKVLSENDPGILRVNSETHPLDYLHNIQEKGKPYDSGDGEFVGGSDEHPFMITSANLADLKEKPLQIARFRIPKGSVSDVMHITSEGYQPVRVGDRGKGYHLFQENGKVYCYEIGDHLEEDNPIIALHYTPDNVHCLIAAPDGPGVEVIEYTPDYEFIESDEEPALDKKGNPKSYVSTEFMHYLNTIKSGNQEEIAKLNIIRPTKNKS